MKSLNKIGILLIILVMTLSNGWIEVIYAEGLANEANSIDTEDVSLEKINDELSIETRVDEAALSLASDSNREFITGGYDFSIARLADGSLWSWGANNLGQLGLGDYENRLHPVKMDSELAKKDLVKILGGSQNAFALTSDGEAYYWGQGVSGIGQVNKPTMVSRAITGKVKDIAWSIGQHALPIQNNHSSYAVLSESGKVYVFGSIYTGNGGRGLTGHGATGACNTAYSISQGAMKPVLTSATLSTCSSNPLHKTVSSGVELTDIKLISGIYYNGYVAIGNDNSIYTWGRNTSLTAHKNVNSDVITGNITKVTSANEEIYALTDKGEVWVWKGRDGLPIKQSITNVKDVASFSSNVMLVTHDGKVYGKGNNRYGQLGAGGNKTNFTDLGLSNIKEIGLGHNHSMFISNDGKITGQGWNSFRQLANEEDGVLESFTKMTTLNGVDFISANEYASNAVKDNQLYSWGMMYGGDFGGSINTPRKITKGNFSNLGNVVGIKGSTAPYNANALVTNTGDAYTWDNNYRSGAGHNKINYTIGKLEHNPNNNAYKPNTVNGVTYVVEEKVTIPPEDIDIIDAVQGLHSGVGIDKTGVLLSWGLNSSGQWGVGSAQRQDYGVSGISGKGSHAFIKVKSSEKFKMVDGRNYTRLALSRAGDVYSWGRNSAGSLGRSGSSLLPVKINQLMNIEEISMGYYTGLALNEAGDIYAWGRNNIGQVGVGSTAGVSTPLNITNDVIDKFESIHSGHDSMYAITTSGELYAWGDNRYGQLGLGDRLNRTSPRKVGDLPGKVSQVASGREHTLILLENGDVYVAGSDGSGQLGRNLPVNSLESNEIIFPDYIELDTKDNQEMKFNDTFRVEGDVTSATSGFDLTLRYEVESSNGIVESGNVLSYKSTSTPRRFSKDIVLDNKYTLGGYTVNMYVKNNNTGYENQSSINFGILDRVSPSSPTVNANSQWVNSSVKVSIVSGIDGESGVDYTEYRINNGGWVRYGDSFTIESEGQHKIEARTVDRAGNESSITSRDVRIDRSTPSVSVTSNIDLETHEDAILTVSATDNLSGIKSIVVNGKDITSESKYVATKNDTYTFVVQDNAGNKTTRVFTVGNIVRELKFEAPQVDEDITVEMQEDMTTEIPVGNIKLTDWRDNNNDWKLSLKATQLKSESYTFPKGTLTLKGIDGINKIDGDKSGSISHMKSERAIDDGAIEIVNATNERGIYDVNFKDDALKFNLTHDVMKGIYRTKLTWRLESTAEIN